MFILPHLRVGGIEHVVARLAAGLDRKRFQPVLFLARAEGPLLATLPPDVRVICGRGRRAGLLAPLIARHIANERPALVYSGTNAANIATLIAAALVRRARRPRVVISEHTSAATYLAGARAGGLRRGLIRLLYPRADRLAAPLAEIGEDWRNTLSLAGPPVAVLPNPVFDRSAMEALAADPPPRVDGLVVAAGRLIPDKGFDVLIEAFARLGESHPAARLEIYGEGPEAARLASLIERRGLAGRVQLCGHADDLPRRLARARIVAAPSRREGFGNVLVEALAVGTEVVASDCAGPHALLDGGRLGTLVAPGDPAALAAALSVRLAAPEDAALRAAGRARVRTYEIPRAIAVFEEMIESLCLSATEPRIAAVQA